MGFKSFLSSVVHDAGHVFSFLGSAQGQSTISTVEGVATGVAAAVNPATGSQLQNVSSLINQGLREVVSVESAAAQAGTQSGTGAQKAAAVTAALAPNISAVLKSLGVAQPTSDQVQRVGQAVSTGIVGILNELPASTTAASTAAASTTPVAVATH
ncbi:hypothetical protein [Occallatibacter riparius]|uniref:Uncharacterized protein n=1 Tax=Occallatibacter riparius TaxID=1002689 RepID=A0A9J7BNF8_9BACT|nr:hypothetical protein [Occallatibacter riparius]UWZ82446.1 hypothetical protein MOP44_17935 [Occallatibacter riparius]